MRISYHSRMDTNAIAIIDAFGGTTVVAELTEAPTSTVQSWKKIGIPPSRMAHLNLLAGIRGVTLPGQKSSPKSANLRTDGPIKGTRKSANVSLAANLVAEAKALDINLSRACEAGLEAALKQERKRRWQEENREAADASNAWVAKHGLPLARYRQF